MAATVRGWRAFRVYCEMIKIEHSIFALPFAMMGMMWASAVTHRSAWPGLETFLLILVAMVACRSAAMAYNRIVDREIDALNPRTMMRALPAGILAHRHATLFFIISCTLFFGAAALLNPLALALSPVALFVTLFYSHTKRYTPLCHFVLGMSLGIAPAAAWIAVSGTLHPAILPITFAVIFWTAGFDIIYSLQDDVFDKENHLRSLPETVGRPRALLISRLCHVAAIGFLITGGVLVGAGLWFFIGVAVAAGLLAYEQSLVSAEDLSRVNMAFFTLNGFVSIGLFAFAIADTLLDRVA
ncbi:MAG TPA: UbiA-like polyprenyltransferase [Fimbriimonadaceae bacterium]|nr:UbiA-like polyprenyltransferase [Fimbriimonadaceae bacterium]